MHRPLPNPSTKQVIRTFPYKENWNPFPQTPYPNNIQTAPTTNTKSYLFGGEKVKKDIIYVEE